VRDTRIGSEGENRTCLDFRFFIVSSGITDSFDLDGFAVRPSRTRHFFPKFPARPRVMPLIVALDELWLFLRGSDAIRIPTLSTSFDSYFDIYFEQYAERIAGVLFARFSTYVSLSKKLSSRATGSNASHVTSILTSHQRRSICSSI